MPRDNAGTTERASKTLLKLPVVKTAYPRAIQACGLLVRWVEASLAQVRVEIQRGLIPR